MTDGADSDDRARSIFERLRSDPAFPAEPSTDPTAGGSEGAHTESDSRLRPPDQPAPTNQADPPEPTELTDRPGPADPPGPGNHADPAEPPVSDPPAADPPVADRPEPAPEPMPAAVPRIAVPPDLDEALTASMAGEPGQPPPTGSELSPTDEFGRARHPGAVANALPRVMAVANQKGGVGKTTTTVNLGASLAELGYRVLVIDLDPQGNATTGLGVNGRNLDASVYDVILHDAPIEDVIEPTTLRNLFVVPATIDLAGAEIELVPVFSRELRLRRALESIEADFDFLLIDCPPSLGLLTVNALAAAGEVLVPIQCEYYALEGLSQLLRNVNLVKSNLNQRLEVSTIVLTMYDARTKLAEQVADEVREHFGSRVCRNVVPRTVRLSEAPSFGQPVTTFDSSSRGAIAYRELAKEVSGGAPQRVR